jgi:hypothetical protein
MRLINFNFTKLYGERLKDTVSEIKFNTKIDILSISSLKSDFLRIKEDLIKIDFRYNILYEPGLAGIELAGTMVLSVEPRIAREVIKGWKEKETPEEFRLFMFNTILRKSSLKALQLEEELNLPPHLPFPAFNKSSMEKKENSENKEDNEAAD